MRGSGVASPKISFRGPNDAGEVSFSILPSFRAPDSIGGSSTGRRHGGLAHSVLTLCMFGAAELVTKRRVRFDCGSFTA